MDIREVTHALRDATTTIEQLNLAMSKLLEEQRFLLAEIDRLKNEIKNWEEAYGPEAPSV